MITFLNPQVLAVPFLAGSRLGDQREIKPITWLCSFGAIAGVSLLEQGGSAPPGVGDVWSLLSAIFFGVQVRMRCPPLVCLRVVSSAQAVTQPCRAHVNAVSSVQTCSVVLLQHQPCDHHITACAQIYRTEKLSRKLPPNSTFQLMSISLTTVAVVAFASAVLAHPTQVRSAPLALRLHAVALPRLLFELEAFLVAASEALSSQCTHVVHISRQWLSTNH